MSPISVYNMGLTHTTLLSDALEEEGRWWSIKHDPFHYCMVEYEVLFRTGGNPSNK